MEAIINAGDFYSPTTSTSVHATLVNLLECQTEGLHLEL